MARWGMKPGTRQQRPEEKAKPSYRSCTSERWFSDTLSETVHSKVRGDTKRRSVCHSDRAPALSPNTSVISRPPFLASLLTLKTSTHHGSWVIQTVNVIHESHDNCHATMPAFQKFSPITSLILESPSEWTSSEQTNQQDGDVGSGVRTPWKRSLGKPGLKSTTSSKGSSPSRKGFKLN